MNENVQVWQTLFHYSFKLSIFYNTKLTSTSLSRIEANVKCRQADLACLHPLLKIVHIICIEKSS